MHAIDLDDGRGHRHPLVLRRWARTDFPTDVGVVENEVAALTVLESESRLAVPRLVAADPHARDTDVPALVMTRLPGRDTLTPRDLDSFVDALAATLRTVHAVPVPTGMLGYYRPWNLDQASAPPPWTRRPDVWERAIEIAHRPIPEHTRVLCHRDFHPGNVLWQRGRVTGVVDWTHTCRGPAAADVAHCRGNLDLLFGLDVADDFTRRYGSVDDLSWFDIVNAVDVGSERPDVWRWHDAGRSDITSEMIMAAIDQRLVDALNRIG